MDTSTLPKYQSVEQNGNKRPRNLPGVYRHEASGKELITSADPNDGQIQADAFVRVGYRRIGDVPSRQVIAARREAQLKKDEAAIKAHRPAGHPDFEADGRVYNGTTEPSTTELKAAKEKAEAELAEARATLEALKSGKESEAKKTAEKEETKG